MQKIHKDRLDAKEDLKAATKENTQTQDDDQNSEGFEDNEIELTEEEKQILIEQERKKMIQL